MKLTKEHLLDAVYQLSHYINEHGGTGGVTPEQVKAILLANTDKALNGASSNPIANEALVDALADYVKSADLNIPTKVSELTNDKKYQTDSDLVTALTPYAKSDDVTAEITTEVAKIVADAPEGFDTLKEMSDWITHHEEDASAMNSAISDNKIAITALQESKADKTDIPTTLPANGGNSLTVNGHTVNSDVPANAKFTDTDTWRPLGTTADTACAGNDSRLSNARPASDVSAWAKASTKPTYTASEVGAYTKSETDTKLNSKINTSLKGSANGLAELDSNGKVLSTQLPSFVDDVLEGYLSSGKFYKESAHTTQILGESGKIYIDLSTERTYRWSGSAFVVISETLALGETSSTAYRGDRGKTAYDHSQSTHARIDATKVEKSSTNGNIKINGTETTVYTHPSGTNPHGTTKSDVGLGNVGNFKAVSTVASQGLTDTEKSNARANIGAGTSSFSGSYNDLSNKPTIPTVGNGTVTIKQAGTSKGTFTMNQSGNTTIELTDNNTTYGVATQSANGLESAADKKKLDGIATGAEVNQNAFSNVVVGSTTITADSKTDSLTLAGSNVTLTPDATNDKLTIGITKSNVTSALGYTPPTSNTNTTYSLSKSGSTITLTGSDGSTTSVTDSDTNTTYSNFVKSGSGAKAGLVPAPSTTAGTTKYLREDGTWSVPPDTNTWRGIQNNLTSDSTTDSLSAAQGKVLKGLVDGKAASNHTHSQYLTSHQDISGKLDNSANGADSLLSKITSSWTTIPTDDTYFIRQDTGGGNTFGRVKFSTLWSYIKGKADKVYAALTHTHTKSQITDFPTSMPASDVSAWAKASSKPSYSWSEITSKPSSFTPASHTHNYAGSSSAGGSANSSLVLTKNSSFNDASTGRVSYYDAKITNTTNNASWSAPSSGWHQIYHNDLSVANYWTELAFPVNDANGLAWRQRRDGSYYGWYRILDSNNYKSYCTPSNIGAADIECNTIGEYHSVTSHIQVKSTSTTYEVARLNIPSVFSDSAKTGTYLINLEMYLNANGQAHFSYNIDGKYSNFLCTISDIGTGISSNHRRVTFILKSARQDVRCEIIVKGKFTATTGPTMYATINAIRIGNY